MVDVVRVPTEAYAWGAHLGPAATVERIRSACADTDRHDPLDEAALLRLKHHGLAGSQLWLVADSGFAFVHRVAGTTYLEVAVAPSARVCGFGRGLVEAALAEMAQVDEDQPAQADDGAAPVVAWSHGDHPAAAALAKRFGFDRARELWMMRITPLAPPEDDRPRDDGVTVRHFQPGDEAELLRVNAAAFAHHAEQGGMTADDLTERMSEPWFDPEGLLMAFDGDRLLGFHWTKVHPGGEGEVYVLGLAPDAQGRGLGRTLTLAGLQHLAGRGVPSVHLYTDADNVAAIAVYEGLGFDRVETHAQYRRG